MVMLMLTGNRPNYFLNGSDVVVFGCPVESLPLGSRNMDALLAGVLRPSGPLESVTTRYPLHSTPQCLLATRESQAEVAGL